LVLLVYIFANYLQNKSNFVEILINFNNLFYSRLNLIYM